MNRLLGIAILVIFICSCQQQVQVSQENLDKIYATKDFTVVFKLSDHTEHYMGFTDDYLTYKHLDKTVRKIISYDNALTINALIQKYLHLHDPSRDDYSIIVSSAQFQVKLNTPDFQGELDTLLQQLNL